MKRSNSPAGPDIQRTASVPSGRKVTRPLCRAGLVPEPDLPPERDHALQYRRSAAPAEELSLCGARGIARSVTKAARVSRRYGRQPNRQGSHLSRAGAGDMSAVARTASKVPMMAAAGRRDLWWRSSRWRTCGCTGQAHCRIGFSTHLVVRSGNARVTAAVRLDTRSLT